MADGSRLIVTLHPSALLRIEDDKQRHAAYRSFVADLKAAATVRSRTSGASAGSKVWIWLIRSRTAFSALFRCSIWVFAAPNSCDPLLRSAYSQYKRERRKAFWIRNKLKNLNRFARGGRYHGSSVKGDLRNGSSRRHCSFTGTPN